MLKIVVEPDRPQMTLLSTRSACRIPKTTNTHSEYAIFIVFFSSATMVALTCLNVTVYALCLSCYNRDRNVFTARYELNV